MSKQFYFGKLVPPRSTFPGDMTDREKQLMSEHARYARSQFEAGRLLIYGPVTTHDGSFGLAVLAVDDEAEARRFFENDPTVLAGLNTFELHSMHVAASRALD
ncbi:MAG: hypothetical protein JOZ50_04250 [Candidatus Eremiobacteraeota bacterium]|nr:hypothetical protein [Candidatus Eremiobacteraeota bacterium]